MGKGIMSDVECCKDCDNHCHRNHKKVVNPNDAGDHCLLLHEKIPNADVIYSRCPIKHVL